MKGVLFNVVEDVVAEVMSVDAWDDVVEGADVEGAYTSLGNYPDSDLMSIVAAVARTAGLDEPDTLRLTGRLGFKHLVRRAPHLLEGLDTWGQVLASLDDIIHPEVRKIYPDAAVPGFQVESVDGGAVVTYTSARQLCALADGLIVGAGEWYDAKLTVTHVRCVHSGDATCVMQVAEAR
ncbi:MAG: heme NO-binding domain-containing protein [Ilumatobacter sp.]